MHKSDIYIYISVKNNHNTISVWLREVKSKRGKYKYKNIFIGYG